MNSKIAVMYDDQKKCFILLDAIFTPEVFIPVGTKSDGFSSPWYCHWFVNPTDQGWIAAWVHDKCYQEAINTKAWADKLFYKNLRRCGVKIHKAKCMYLAVKLFGRGCY